MKIVSVKYVHEVASKILDETLAAGSLSEHDRAVLHTGFRKLTDKLYATSDDAPEVLEFLKELAVITSGLTQRAADGLETCPNCRFILNFDTCPKCGEFVEHRR